MTDYCKDTEQQIEEHLYEKFNTKTNHHINHFKEEYLNAQTELFSFTNEFYGKKWIPWIPHEQLDQSREIDFLEVVVHYDCILVSKSNVVVFKKVKWDRYRSLPPKMLDYIEEYIKELDFEHIGVDCVDQNIFDFIHKCLRDYHKEYITVITKISNLYVSYNLFIVNCYQNIYLLK